jgi:hypothetical protein
VLFVMRVVSQNPLAVVSLPQVDNTQLVHNAQVQVVQTEEVSADELWSFVSKNIHQCLPDELEAGDCWIGVSLADSSGLLSGCTSRETHRRIANRN